eukprot:198639-Rhodomonas_salina.2
MHAAVGQDRGALLLERVQALDGLKLPPYAMSGTDLGRVLRRWWGKRNFQVPGAVCAHERA